VDTLDLGAQNVVLSKVVEVFIASFLLPSHYCQ